MIGYLSIVLVCAAMSVACYADDGGPCALGFCSPVDYEARAA
jgi:hypothetical protein